jgi:hypothetical protein
MEFVVLVNHWAFFSAVGKGIYEISVLFSFVRSLLSYLFVSAMWHSNAFSLSALSPIV